MAEGKSSQLAVNHRQGWIAELPEGSRLDPAVGSPGRGRGGHRWPAGVLPVDGGGRISLLSGSPPGALVTTTAEPALELTEAAGGRHREVRGSTSSPGHERSRSNVRFPGRLTVRRPVGTGDQRSLALPQAVCPGSQRPRDSEKDPEPRRARSRSRPGDRAPGSAPPPVAGALKGDAARARGDGRPPPCPRPDSGSGGAAGVSWKGGGSHRPVGEELAEAGGPTASWRV